MIDITDFDKDQLAKYSMENFKIDLDLRKSLSTLKAEVVRLQNKKEPKAGAAPEAPAAKTQATHILNRSTGMIFPWTDALRKHLTNAIPCDENGNPV